MYRGMFNCIYIHIFTSSLLYNDQATCLSLTWVVAFDCGRFRRHRLLIFRLCGFIHPNLPTACPGIVSLTF